MDEKETVRTYMADAFIEVLEKYGPYNFFGLVSDNAANMKSSWKQVEQEYPHISTYGCLAHGLNLLLSDIMRNELISCTIHTAKEVIKQIISISIKSSFKRKEWNKTDFS